MADEDELAAGGGETAGLVVDFGHQGARGIDGGHLAPPGLVVDAVAHPVGGEHDAGPVGHFRQFLHEHGAGGFQAGDNVRIVDYLAAHVDRRAVALQCPLDRLDGALHTGAERPRLGQQYLPRPGRRRPVGQRPPAAAQAVQPLEGAHGTPAGENSSAPGESDTALSTARGAPQSAPARAVDSMSTTSAPRAASAARWLPLTRWPVLSTVPVRARRPSLTSSADQQRGRGQPGHLAALVVEEAVGHHHVARHQARRQRTPEAGHHHGGRGAGAALKRRADARPGPGPCPLARRPGPPARPCRSGRGPWPRASAAPGPADEGRRPLSPGYGFPPLGRGPVPKW